MKKSERNLLVLLGTILLFALPYLYSSLNLGGAGDGSYYSEEKIAELKHKQNQLPEIDLQLLENEKENFKGSKRNLFIFGDAIDETAADDEEVGDEEEDAEDPYAVDAETEAQQAAERKPVKPSLAGYQYVGYHLSKKDRTAAFQWRGQIFVGRIGDTINRAFEIKEIKENFTTIHVIKGDFEQQLKLRSPVSSNGGN